MAINIEEVTLTDSGESSTESHTGPEMSGTETAPGSTQEDQLPGQGASTEASPESLPVKGPGEPSQNALMERLEEWRTDGADPLEFLGDATLVEGFPKVAKMFRGHQKKYTEVAQKAAEVSRMHEEWKRDKEQFERETAEEVVPVSTGDTGEASLAFSQKQYNELMAEDPSGTAADLYRMRCDNAKQARTVEELLGYVKSQKQKEREAEAMAQERQRRAVERDQLVEVYIEEFGLTRPQARGAATIERGERFDGYSPDRRHIANLAKTLPKLEEDLTEVLEGKAKPKSPPPGKGAGDQAVGAAMLNRAIKSAGKPARPGAATPVAEKPDRKIWKTNPDKAGKRIADNYDLID